MVSARRQLKDLRRRPIPAWWRDAKLGLFVHWTPASVPAFAPTEREIGELLASDEPDPLGSTPYAEWYENSLRFPDSPVARHHREVHGDRPYVEFARDWEDGLEQWDPDRWAATFAATGARYVVLVTKHADGYCLWPTDVEHPHRPGWHSRRDVVGELADAVRRAGMRFGCYYCGGFDWSFDATPVGSMADVVRAIPRGDYPRYAEAQVRELVDRYEPSVLWNDVAWPAPAEDLWPLLADYYRAVPDGVVNDRWMPWSPLLGVARSDPARRLVDAASRRQARRDGGLVPPRPPHFDHRTPEYADVTGTDPTPWELVRGMDRSFAFNAASGPADFVALDDLTWQLADVVAKGGNLLLNVGPRGTDATIPDEQADRLAHLGAFVGACGDALVATRPWVVPGSTTAEGDEVRYTTRDRTVHALLRTTSPTATLTEVVATPTTVARGPGGTPIPHRSEPGGLVLDLSAVGGAPIAVALHDVRPRAGVVPTRLTR